jgi:hypothetical protein
MVLVDKRAEGNRERRRAHAVNAFGIGEPLENAVKRHQRAERDDEQDQLI